MTFEEFLGADQTADGSWRFDIPRELHGAFGGAFGGVVAAATVFVARSTAEGRVPMALDTRFLRSLPAGTATATASVLHSGRTMSCVTVDLSQPDGKLAARSTVSLVNPDALADVTKERAVRSIPSYDEGRAWPPIGAPIVDTLAPRSVPWDEGAAALSIKVPWDVDERTSAEAVCLPADMCVGPPVAPVVFGEQGRRLASPNPDLSLRFAAPVTSEEVIGVGRLERVHAGVATVDIEVWSATGLCAVGVSTSTLIAMG